MEEKNFAKGLIVKRNEKAPDFVTCNLSVKVDEFTEWAKQNANNGWVNIQCKQSKGGKYYAELDTWKPKEQTASDQSDSTKDEGDLPF